MRNSAVFVASYPKSGNTWVRLFIGCYIFGLRLEKIIKADYSPLLENAKRFSDLTGREFTRDNFFKYRGEYFSKLKEISPIIKTHMPYRFEGKQYFPQDAFCVYLIRRPNSVISSFAKHMGMDRELAFRSVMLNGAKLRFANSDDVEDPYYSIHTWKNHIYSWVASNNRTLFINYESLVLNYREIFQKVILFLGLDFDRDRFEFALSEVGLDKLQIYESDHGFNEASKHNEKFFGSVGNHSEEFGFSELGEEKINKDLNSVVSLMSKKRIGLL